MSDMLTELRPNSDPEFEAAWEAKFGPQDADTQTAEESGETPVEQTDTETPADRQRDDQGRFVRVDAPPVDDHGREAELEAEEEQEQRLAAGEQPTEDEVLAKYLEKYNGDVRQALLGAVNAQQLIGRRDEEKDDLRARLEALEQRQGLPQPQAQPAQGFRPITEADVNTVDELAVGGRGAEAFELATKLDPTGMLARRALDTWTAVNPTEAMLFTADRMSDAKLAQLRAELQPVVERNQASEADQDFVQAWTTLAGNRPEIDELANEMKAVIDERPQLARMILDGDVNQKIDTLGIVADLARASKPLQSPEVREAIEAFAETQRAGSRAEKVAATVTKPKAQIGAPTGGEQSQKSPRELEAERIKSGIVDAPDTSISSGWTTE